MIGTNCPSREELAAFAVGDLPRQALARVAGHVEECPACETTLQTLDGLPDPLVAALRQPAPGDGTVDHVPAGLLSAARSARGPRGLACWATGERPCRLGKFELLEELGAGSFGRVFRARDAELDRVVAIK